MKIIDMPHYMTLKRLAPLLFLSLLSLSFTTACSTVSGMGKDIQKAGQVIEREADKNNKKKQ